MQLVGESCSRRCLAEVCVHPRTVTLSDSLSTAALSFTRITETKPRSATEGGCCCAIFHRIIGCCPRVVYFYNLELSLIQVHGGNSLLTLIEKSQLKRQEETVSN